MKVVDGIDELPSGHFRLRKRVRGRDIGETFASLEEAIAARDAIKAVLASGRVLVGETIRDLGPKFLASRAPNRNADTDAGRWHKHIASARLALLPIREVTRADVKHWIAALRTKRTDYDPKRHGKRSPKPLSWQTRRHCLNLLRRFFAWAIDGAELPEKSRPRQNPCAGLTITREDGDEEEGFQQGWYLDKDDQARLLATWDQIEGFDSLDRAEKWITAFAIGTGLREGELACLHLAHVRVDDDDPHVVVHYGSFDRDRDRFRSPKGVAGSRRIRRVELFGIALHAAREWLSVMSNYAPKNPRKLMFPTRRGCVRDQKPPRTWKVVVEAFGLVPRIGRKLWWHLLRHTCASSLVSGAWGTRWSLEDVQAIMGHADIRTTQRYAHLAPAAVAATARRAHAAYESSGCHGVVTAARPDLATAATSQRRVRQDSNLRPTAPEDVGSTCLAEGSARRDEVVTTIVEALQALATNDPHAVRKAIEALGAALDVVRSIDAAAMNGGRRAS